MIASQVRARFRVQAVDLEYYKRNIPCQYACPAQTDARGYVQAIARGDWRQGYELARQPNPFASACARVCLAPCEAACRRGKMDAPIPIRALKRFLTQRCGVEGDYAFPQGDWPVADNGSTWESQRQTSRRSRRRGERVAIIGSGPGGLTCAHDLALLGYQVAVFETLPYPGGYMATAIPEYRLPRSVIDRELEAILRLRVELRASTDMPQEAALGLLRREGYGAVFLATGIEKKQRLSWAGEGVFCEADTGVEGHGIIHAVAVGHRAALLVEGYLEGARPRIQRRARLVPVSPQAFFDLNYLDTGRRDPPSLSFAVGGEMERPYSAAAAVEQARRCLNCHIQTVFDGQKCILCNGCVDVCPMRCLKLARFDSLEIDREVAAFIGKGDGEAPLAAMLKDETACIRCGLCQRRCPTGAVQLMEFLFEEEVVYD